MGREAVKLTADTNILVRAMMNDDPTQSLIAQQLLNDAALVVVPTAAICEFARVLSL